MTYTWNRRTPASFPAAPVTAADPCFLLRVIRTPDDVRRTLTAGMYPTPEAAMLASECEVWTNDMLNPDAAEWSSDDGEWIIRRAMT